VALIAWLKREGFGTYASVDEFVGELARRSTSALGALGAALYSSPDDLQEAARGAGQVTCTDVVRDLRVARGARLAALRGLLLSGPGAQLPRLYAGVFDLLADVRLPEADRLYLCRQGLKGFLESVPPGAVTMEIARACAGAAEAAKILPEVVREVLAGFPPDHTAAITARHAALGEPLPADLETRWIEALSKQFRAARAATPAAKRLGTAPEWPPVVPDALRPLLPRAEAAAPPAAPAKTAPKTTAPAVPPTPKPSNRPGLAAPLKPGAAPPPAPAPRAPDLRPEAAAGLEPPPVPKMQPPLRSRARAVVEESFAADSRPVSPAALSSRPAPKPAAAEPAPATGAASAPAPAPAPAARKAAPLRSMRFGEQVDLVATRGVRALERLIAAFDVRAGVAGTDAALAELSRAAAARGSRDVNEPMMDELAAFAGDPKTPSPWRRAVKTVLAQLSPERAQALGFSAAAE